MSERSEYVSSLLTMTKHCLVVKKEIELRRTRAVVARELHIKQSKDIEKQLEDKIAEVIDNQVQMISEELLELASEDEKGIKHLAGQHNQMTHGSGSSGVPNARTFPKPYGKPESQSVRPALDYENRASRYQSSLSDDQTQALADYSNSDFGLINGFLRGSYSPDSDQEKHELAHKVEKLDSTMSMISPANMEVWRATPIKGSEYTDAGFVSTTYDKSTAREFKDKFGGSVQRIVIPKGARVAWIGSLSKKGEGEVLLPRGGTFKKTKLKDGSFAHVFAPPLSKKHELAARKFTTSPTGHKGSRTYGQQAEGYVRQVYSASKHTEEIVDAALPVLAAKMSEAMVAQMMSLGIDPREKGLSEALYLKHLAGQHNQITHGKGGMAECKRGKDRKLTMPDGSPLPDHIPKNIPPAWEHVMVATDPKAEVLVKGMDKKGRVQTVYSKAHWARVAKAKFSRVNELRKKSKSIRKELDKDATNPAVREEACCLRLVQSTGIRPGSTKSTGADKQAYGATTLEGRHVRVQGGKVRLKFTGKKGVGLSIPVTDSVVANDLKKRKNRAGARGKVFETDANKLSRYSHSKNGGKFKTKDFRTAKGTSTAVEAIKQMPKPTTQKDYKKAVKEVGKQVAEQLGNTPTVALQSYVDPMVFSGWRPT